MRDIRKPYRNSRSNLSGGEIKPRERESFASSRESRREISKKAEMFEKGEYEDIDYTKDGKPLMRASSHFDLSNGMMKRKKRNDFDVLKREEFFNSKKRDFDEDDARVYKKAINKKKRKGKFFLYAITLLLLITFAALTFVFDFASVNINPKYKDVDVSDTFIFFKEDVIVDTASSTLSKTVLKSEPKEVNQKSMGEITIYNNYSGSAQVLIKNTRFQSPEGKIFRIGDSVTVPGKVGDTPGQIKVKVSADSYGADYNIGPSDFTIPGFKGTPRYEGFYAKSTDDMKGGASGVVQVVAESDINNANNELKLKVEEELKNIYNNFVHENYYTLYGTPLIALTDNGATLTTSDENAYRLTGIATVFSIKKDVLARMIAEQVLKGEYNSGEPVRLQNIDGLGFSLSEDMDPSSNVIKVVITGKTRIIWDYDEERLKQSLVGQSISNFNSVIKNYDYAIVNASLKFKPIWLRSLPNSVNKIKIVEEIN